jgi:anti-sigma B factor antagonist
MAEPETIVHVVDRRGVKLARLKASALLTEEEVEALGAGLEALAELPGQRVVLSFLGVTHITSVVLRRLIEVHRRLKESGGELRLADIEAHVYEMFTITRLDRLFRIYEREDDAIASFLEAAGG